MARKKKIEIPKYKIDIYWSKEDECFISNVPELKNCRTHGETYEEAASMAREAIEGYVEALLKSGEEPPVPISEQDFSGKFNVRAGSDIHRKAVLAAASEEKSLNKFVVDAIKDRLKSG